MHGYQNRHQTHLRCRLRLRPPHPPYPLDLLTNDPNKAKVPTAKAPDSNPGATFSKVSFCQKIIFRIVNPTKIASATNAVLVTPFNLSFTSTFYSPRQIFFNQGTEFSPSGKNPLPPETAPIPTSFYSSTSHSPSLSENLSDDDHPPSNPIYHLTLQPKPHYVSCIDA